MWRAWKEPALDRKVSFQLALRAHVQARDGGARRIEMTADRQKRQAPDATHSTWIMKAR